MTTVSGAKPKTALSLTRRRGFPLNIELLLCGVILMLFVAMAFVPALFTEADPILADPVHRLLAPAPEHPFGTDASGRDVFSRMVYGAGLSLKSALLAVAISAGTGAILGLMAGFFGGWVDTVISRLSDAVLAIPGLLLALALLSALGKGSLMAAVAIGLANIPVFVRLTRAESMRVGALTYVEAARAGGVRRFGVLASHVLPNSIGPVAGLAVLEFGQALLAIGALSYLGFGEAPPTPEWGSLIASGQAYLQTAWWLSILPGLVLAIVVLVINRTAHLLQKRA
jgi:peptide/nickel transport system permease protein